MKTCTLCLVEKSKTEFHNCKRTPDGLNWRCKDCVNAATQKSRAKDPEKTRAAGRAQYWKKPEERRVYALNRRNADVLKARLDSNEWKRLNPERDAEYHKQWRAENPDKVKKMDRRKHLKTYGITQQDYDAKVESQDGKCIICKRLPTSQGLCVDHCHESGRIRDLLCSKCNVILGLADDNPEILSAAAKYLEYHSGAISKEPDNAWVTGSLIRRKRQAK